MEFVTIVAFGKCTNGTYDHSYAFGKRTNGTYHHSYAFGKCTNGTYHHSYAFGKRTNGTYHHSYGFGKRTNGTYHHSYAFGKHTPVLCFFWHTDQITFWSEARLHLSFQRACGQHLDKRLHVKNPKRSLYEFYTFFFTFLYFTIHVDINYFPFSRNLRIIFHLYCHLFSSFCFSDIQLGEHLDKS